MKVKVLGKKVIEKGDKKYYILFCAKPLSNPELGYSTFDAFTNEKCFNTVTVGSDDIELAVFFGKVNNIYLKKGE